MQNPFRYISNKNRADFIRYALLAMGAIIVLVIIPKKGKFKYEYEQNKSWIHEELTAPFTFAIQKSQAEMAQEQNEVTENFRPYFDREAKTANEEKNRFITNISLAMGKDTVLSNNLKRFYISAGINILDDIYKRGIINMDSSKKSKSENAIITEVQGNVVKDKKTGDYFTLGEARKYISDSIQKDTILNRTWFVKSLWTCLSENVVYDKALSDKKQDELLSSVSGTKGIVRQGEKIISRG